MEFKGRDIISIEDFSQQEINHILDTAKSMEPLAKGGSDMLKGKILATLFFEPSTRTRLSFETAMLKLGGNYIGFAEPDLTSARKGENLADTVRTVENYADAIALRHSLEGSAKLAAEFSKVPIINAGTGAEEHPTQALIDLYTIRKEKGKIDGLKVALVGDLRYGRTVHSLAYALAQYNVELYLVSPDTLRMRKDVLSTIKNKIPVTENAKEFIVGTEEGILHRLRKENPTKTFYLAYEGAICPNMKLTTLDRIYASLKEEKNLVAVPEAVAKKARASLERMFEVKS